MVETLGDRHERNALLVEIGDDVGGVGDGAEEPVQFRDDHDRLALFRGGKELAARGPASEWLAATDSRVLENLAQVESFHSGVGGNALALGFESQPTIGLLFT